MTHITLVNGCAAYINLDQVSALESSYYTSPSHVTTPCLVIVMANGREYRTAQTLRIGNTHYWAVEDNIKISEEGGQS